MASQSALHNYRESNGSPVGSFVELQTNFWPISHIMGPLKLDDRLACGQFHSKPQNKHEQLVHAPKASALTKGTLLYAAGDWPMARRCGKVQRPPAGRGLHPMGSKPRPLTWQKVEKQVFKVQCCGHLQNEYMKNKHGLLGQEVLV